MSPDSPTTQIHFGELHRGHVIVLPTPDHGQTWTVVDHREPFGGFDFVDYVTPDGWEGIHGEPPQCPVIVTAESHLRSESAA